MKEDFSLQEYLEEGIEHIVKNIMKSSFKNPKESAYILKYIMAVKEAEKKRNYYGERGEEIPPFFMGSISNRCNLFCKGCYARANQACGSQVNAELSEKRWGEIFSEAKELGISFILLLGGEPLMRRDVIMRAAKIKEIMFPIFTNGTMLDEAYLTLFDENRNLVPMLSIEGREQKTDERRGKDTYQKVKKAMDLFNSRGILYGCSITVTRENVVEVTSEEFVRGLYKNGARGIIYAEYVPVEGGTKQLAPTDRERKSIRRQIALLRKTFDGMVILAFPGDEKYSDGCLAAGRGFFHINAAGGAEPCPFSPYSDISLKDKSLLEALKSPLFAKLKEDGLLSGDHDGGCILFEKAENVSRLLGL